jgi:elongation factor 1-gamma
MSFGKIYTYPNNPRVQKALIAAKYNDLKVDVAEINIGVDNKTDEYVKKFPLGKVPAFEGADGFTLYESSAIAYYVANKEGTTLFGKNRKDQALVQQFIALSDNEFSPIASAWLYPIMGYYPLNKEATEKAKENLKRVFAALNKHFATHTFLGW